MFIDSKIIAHRGVFDNKKIVENTLDAFRKAIDYNYPFELDVQLTSDGEIVVYHDDTLSRLCGDNSVVQDTPYSQLKRFHLLETTSGIPLLKDVLKINNDRVLIDIEIKHTKKIKETVTALMIQLKKYKKFVIKSFDPKIVRFVKTNYPDVMCGLLVKTKYKNPFFNFFIKKRIMLSYSKCDFVAISKNLLQDEEYCKIIKNIPKMVWTITNKDEIINGEDYIYICNNLPYKKEEKKKETSNS